MLWNFQSKQCDHHAGYDAEPGTLKAKLNVRGNLLIGELAEKLDFPFKRNGSLVLCLDEKDYPNLQKLYEKGITNGVKKLRILNHDEVLEMEPNVSENVYAALYAPTGGIVCPFNMTIAFAENACVNGVEFRFDTEVLAVSPNARKVPLTLLIRDIAPPPYPPGLAWPRAAMCWARSIQSFP